MSTTFIVVLLIFFGILLNEKLSSHSTVHDEIERKRRKDEEFLRKERENIPELEDLPDEHSDSIN